MKKILYSPGYGAGWSTWMGGFPFLEPSSSVRQFACEYQPIIDAIERGEKLSDDHPIIKQFVKDCRVACGLADDEHVCTLGASQLKVLVIPDDAKYYITEYDGCESVLTDSTIKWVNK